MEFNESFKQPKSVLYLFTISFTFCVQNILLTSMQGLSRSCLSSSTFLSEFFLQRNCKTPPAHGTLSLVYLKLVTQCIWWMVDSLLNVK